MFLNFFCNFYFIYFKGGGDWVGVEREGERIPSRPRIVGTEADSGSNSQTVRWWPEPKPRVGHWTNWAAQAPPQRPKFLTEISLLTYIEGNLENWKHRPKQTKLTDGSAGFLLLFWHNLVQFRTPVQEYQVSSIIFLVKIWPRQYLAHIYTKRYSLFYCFSVFYLRFKFYLDVLSLLVGFGGWFPPPPTMGTPVLGSLWAFSVFPVSVQISKYLAAKCHFFV